MKPILFSTPMVRAILAGTKTQTRRVVKEPLQTWMLAATNPKWHEGMEQQCPYGQPGDILWVREEHYAAGHWEKNGLTKTGKQKWRFVADTSRPVMFDKPIPFEVSRNKQYPEKVMWYKRLARFMPKKYARTYLLINSIRVERLNDISEHDAIAEGIEKKYMEGINEWRYRDYVGLAFPANYWLHARKSFRSLWDLVHGLDSWGSNPWVWVVEFERCERPA